MTGFVVDAAMLIGSDGKTAMSAVHLKYLKRKKELVSLKRSENIATKEIYRWKNLKNAFDMVVAIYQETLTNPDTSISEHD